MFLAGLWRSGGVELLSAALVAVVFSFTKPWWIIVLLPPAIAALYLLLNARRGLPPGETPLALRRPASGLVIGSACGALPVLATRGILWMTGDLSILDQELHLLAHWRFAVFAAELLAFAVAEELVFRGLVLEALERWAGSVVAIGLSSAAFALTHFPLDWSRTLSVGSSGVVYGALMVATRSLWAPIAGHLAHNLVVLGLFSSAVVEFRLHASPLHLVVVLMTKCVIALALVFWAKRQGRLAVSKWWEHRTSAGTAHG